MASKKSKKRNKQKALDLTTEQLLALPKAHALYPKRFELAVVLALKILQSKGRIARFFRTVPFSDLDLLGIDFVVYMRGKAMPMYIQVKRLGDETELGDFEGRQSHGDFSTKILLLEVPRKCDELMLVNMVSALLDGHTRLPQCWRDVFHYLLDYPGVTTFFYTGDAHWVVDVSGEAFELDASSVSRSLRLQPVAVSV